MKCPICGQELRPGKKDPNYLLCYNCKKKFKAPQAKKAEKSESQYSNIPPKSVRDKREKEMRKAYDEMLSVEDERGKKKKSAPKSRRDDYDYDDYDYDNYDDVYDDEPVSKVPIIILGVAIVIVAAVIAYMLFFK